MLNQVVIMGRLVRDPELRYTQSNTAVTSFALAVERDFANKDGTKPVDFIECLAWKHTAEFVNKYFSKGRMAIVSGQLQVRTWEDKEGKNRKSYEVVAQSVYFGDSKPKDEREDQQQMFRGGYGQDYSTPSTPEDVQEIGGFSRLEDDNLPF